ncbi:hypothetical protein [Cellulomonas sp. PhB143]|uniref:AAA family ATPase n=1 Tax=Cellulomonas sp. PhB143 TaxID=2485186 RepID=UPI000FBFCBDE|nr:hypothetical protein [Cellulomonas sp. PhB143]ROS78506.1 MinD-like ATPase involved in chromosome partitioning or flagellar assembly [Cellulomonas sp. PhB143]
MSLGAARSSGASATTVLCALRGPAEARTVEALAARDGQVSVTRRCADVRELRAAAAAGAGTVALVAADLDGLDGDLVADLTALGVRTLALGGSEHDARRAHALGLVVLARDVSIDDLVSELVAGVDRRGGGRTQDEPDARHGPDGPGAEPAPHGAGPVAARRPGRVVAVWGPTGAPGRTTVAVNLAAELALGPSRQRRARRRLRPGRARAETSAIDVPPDEISGAEHEVLLVDVDTYGGAVAQHLGMLDESPGLVAATRSAGRGALDARGLAALSPFVAPRLRVLTGIARAARWPEVSATALDQVWVTARGLADHVVVDCGFGVEQDEALSYDTAAPQRNGATLSALAAADVIVVVGAADPVGVQRLVRALEDLDDLLGPGARARRVVVANRVRAGSAGPGPRAAVRDVLSRFAALRDPVLLADDRRACDRAVLEGRALHEVAPESTLRREIVGLAARVQERTAGSAPRRTGQSGPATSAPAAGALVGGAH